MLQAIRIVSRLSLLWLGFFVVLQGPALRAEGEGAKAANDKNAAAKRAAVPPATQARLMEAYGKLPLSFEPNSGQADSRVKYLARGRGYNLLLTPTEAVLSLPTGNPSRDRLPRAQSRGEGATTEFPSAGSNTVLRMKLAGANPNPLVSGLDELPGKSNYFLGNDPKLWRTNVPTYAKVKYDGVYPGVDLVYYGNQGQLEYDFVVAPGGHPEAIAFELEGVRKMALDEQGDLALQVTEQGGELRLHHPVAYQEVNEEKQAVAARFVVRDGNRIGFEVGAYDPRRPLIIDPIILIYSTYLGGGSLLKTGESSSSDKGYGIAVDAFGNAYITGQTDFFWTYPRPDPYSDFPRTSTPLGFQGPQSCLDGSGLSVASGDAFVTKMNPAGTALVYSTFLGGGGPLATCLDIAYDIAVDAGGNAWVTGGTQSSSFPTTPTAYQPTFTPTCSGSVCQSAVFVTKLNETGSGLLYSTYLHGADANYLHNDIGHGIAVDGLGYAYVVGETTSTDFPIKGGFQTILAGGTDAFVAKLDASKSGAASLLYSTYLGGSVHERGYGIAVDPTQAGVVFVVGETSSTDFPTTPGAYQTSLKGGSNTDAFVTKLDTMLPDAASLVYSTYLGGTGGEADTKASIAVDASGDAYVTGATRSTDFPTKNAYSTYHSDGVHLSRYVFVSKLHPGGGGDADLIYSTYLGGNEDDTSSGIAVDSAGNAYVTGTTLSHEFPTTPGALQGALAAFPTCDTNVSGNCPTDAFVTELNSTGSALVYSTYLGGRGIDLRTLGTGSENGINRPYGDIALDSASPPNIYVTGSTSSYYFPVTPGAYKTILDPIEVSGIDAFVSKIGLVLQANLSVTKTDSPDPVLVGGTLTYTMVVRNGGPDTATGVTLTDPLPAGVNYVTFTATQGSGCSLSSGVVNCSLGSLANAATATVTITVTPTTTGTKTNNVTVASSVNDPALGDNTALAITTVNPAADLKVTKSGSPNPVLPGGTLTYTMVVTNLGPSPATGVTLTDPIVGVTYVSAFTTLGSCTMVKAKGKSTVNCAIGTLANGASATVTLVVTVPKKQGPTSNTATVSATEADPNAANNSATGTVTISR